ncbi:MAG: DUF1467 family protein [Alphaproteobacteria bacterium]|nr:DUF1467 family protein [Alphaproteobacteria bacterium]
MDVVSGVVVYILLWWWVFFMTLPFGARSPKTPELGHATSAPINPYLLRKVLATTVIAAVLLGGVYWSIDANLFSFRDAIRDW